MKKTVDTKAKGLRYIGYSRVSTQKQVDSGLSLAIQDRELDEEGARREWTCVAKLSDKGKSAKTMSRDGLQVALELLKAKKADVLLVTKGDRATRDMEDYIVLKKLARKQGWALVDMGFDMDESTAMGKGMGLQKALWGELERLLIAERTQAAMDELKAKGVKLGQPSPLSPETNAYVLKLKTEGLSIRKIAARLQEEGVATATGAPWHPTTVARILDRAAAAA